MVKEKSNMKQILAKDKAIIISNTEVLFLDHPSTIYTDDDVVVKIGKTDEEVKTALTVSEIKKALGISKVEYSTKATKNELLSRLYDEKVISDITPVIRK